MTAVTLGGRQYAALDFEHRTVRWQLHVDRLVAETGIDRVLPVEGEPDEAYLLRLHAAVMRSGRACDLLACFLLPEGVTELDWTPEIAAATATDLGRLNTDADVQAVYQLGMEFVLGFFGRLLRWLRSSPSSSAVAAGRQPLVPPAAA